MSKLAPEVRYALLHQAHENIATVLADHLPAGPDDPKPPPHWPGWRFAYQLMDAKLKITAVLKDLPDTTAT